MREIMAQQSELVHRVAIFGAGVSGQAARRLCQDRGYASVLFDEKGNGDRREITAADLSEFDRFVWSPGFAEGHAWRALVAGLGKLSQSEVAFAASHWRGKVIGVTGTNGKTSLTRLLVAALREVGVEASAVGNIGHAFSDTVVDVPSQADTWAVCELSSFQAELPEGLMLDGLVWTNFAEDHLDRYSSQQAYFEAKARLFGCLKVGAPCLIGASVVEWAGIYGLELPASASLMEDTVMLALSASSPFAQAPQSANYAMACSLWAALGFPMEALQRAADAFELSAHRLACCGRIGDVTFWNDSKATNFHAVESALDNFSGPVFWIGGGVSKGGDIAGFTERISGKIEAAFAFGAVGPELVKGFQAVNFPVSFANRFEDMVRLAGEAALTRGEGIVLMSPGFASFDQFTSYAERGKSFISIVLGLMETRTME